MDLEVYEATRSEGVNRASSFQLIGLVTSIIVNVPEDIKLSEWWGIAVCLALEPSNMDVSSPSYVRPTSTGNEEMCIYYWVCKAPDRYPDPKFPIASKFGHLVNKFNDPYVHIIFLNSDHVYIQHYLSGEQSKLQLIFFVENLSESCKATIKKCGCRVICKEKIEEWRKHSDGLNISRLTEMNDDEGCHHELEVEEPTSPNASSPVDKPAVNTIFGK
ncbi:TMV resistance protein N [Spatholobus suberectus]|nr:TMV resistance protein N [Spatholobus suberectus]